MGGVVEWEV
jgi:hypothetical protein